MMIFQNNSKSDETNSNLLYFWTKWPNLGINHGHAMHLMNQMWNILKTTFWDQIWHNLGACRPNKNGQHDSLFTSMGYIFSKLQKLHFGPFWALSPKLGQTRFFSFKNWAVTFEPLWTSTSCKRLDICNVTCIWSNCRIHPELFWR